MNNNYLLLEGLLLVFRIHIPHNPGISIIATWMQVFSEFHERTNIVTALFTAIDILVNNTDPARTAIGVHNEMLNATKKVVMMNTFLKLIW